MRIFIALACLAFGLSLAFIEPRLVAWALAGVEPIVNTGWAIFFAVIGFIFLLLAYIVRNLKIEGWDD